MLIEVCLYLRFELFVSVQDSEDKAEAKEKDKDHPNHEDWSHQILEALAKENLFVNSKTFILGLWKEGLDLKL